MMLTLEPNWIRSPFGMVRSLLSSSTLFKDSTHSGSTSPSHIIQLRCSRGSCTTWRTKNVNGQSKHPHPKMTTITCNTKTIYISEAPTVCTTQLKAPHTRRIKVWAWQARGMRYMPQATSALMLLQHNQKELIVWKQIQPQHTLRAAAVSTPSVHSLVSRFKLPSSC